MVTAAIQFSVENMVVAVDPLTGYFVVDRFPMRKSTVPKNVRNRYQVLSPDQKVCKVFRGKKKAQAYLLTI